MVLVKHKTPALFDRGFVFFYTFEIIPAIYMAGADDKSIKTRAQREPKEHVF